MLLRKLGGNTFLLNMRVWSYLFSFLWSSSFWQYLTCHISHPLLTPSADIIIFKEEQPMRIMTHCQGIPRFALHGRYSTVFLVHHSWLIYIRHSRNEWESSPVKDPRPLAIHHSPTVPENPHQTKLNDHTTGLRQYYHQCCQ